MSEQSPRKIATLPANATALTNHTMDGRSLPPAHYIVSEEHSEGVYLFRYSSDWQFSGDTWHQNLDDLLAQVDYEFGTTQLEWRSLSEIDLLALTN